MSMGRPKLENPHNRRLEIRLSEDQFQEICKLAEKFKISRTEVILRGIKNLSQIQPVYYRVKPKKIPKHSEGIIAED